MLQNQLHIGQAREILQTLPSDAADLVYLDPPFFTQRKHRLKSKANEVFEFDDYWVNIEAYKASIRAVLVECRRVLKATGSIFLHCDKTAAHHLRCVLEEVFGVGEFRSEIIWAYRRWSNAKKGLLNSHQNIFFYSKTKDYQFNTLYTSYSPATNLDQILQDRCRDENGKSIYKTDENQETILAQPKKGVPLSDVWEIPLLNPKANERVGYPTQKPVELLQRIINISTVEGDLVLDPMCGSGTTCVAAKSLKRNFIGIDKSPKAIDLAKKRLEEMIISPSKAVEKDIDAFIGKATEEQAILAALDAFPVHRNNGIDGYLKDFVDGKPVPIKIQRPSESLEIAFKKLEKATQHPRYHLKILIQTKADEFKNKKDDTIRIVPSPKYALFLH